jgi:hypothetical protein
MSRSRRLLPYVLAALAACGGDPSGPSTGSLDVVVSGLPTGTSAAVTVTGPGGYTHPVVASETLSGLMPGAYTVAADAVSSSGQSYQPNQSTQSVNVGGSTSPVSALVSYGLVGANLTVNVAGLPPGVAAAISVSGPGGYDQPVTATTTLSGLAPGVYSVTAESVAPAGAQYDPSSPATQAVNLVAAANGSASVSYTSASAPGLNLRIDGMYLTQSVQTYAGGVPLVQDRDGYLRVFVTASQSNLATPQVRVRFYSNGTPISTMTIPAPALSVPLSPDESSLSASWNIPVPKALIQPNLSILADVDPSNTVAETNEGDNAFPSSGTPLAMDVRTTTPFSVTLVPVFQEANQRLGNVTPANKDGFLTAAMSLHPLAGYDAIVHPLWSTSRPAVESDNANKAWTDILADLEKLRLAEGSSRHYFGVIDPVYNSGIAGIGYVGGRVALGWDKGGNDMVAAHEWGHNWGRKHAPCGGAGDPDLSYPYAGGTIGVYGFDVAAQSLKPRSNADLMGYCNNEWISDYTYTAVLNYRAAQPDVAASFAQAMQPCLLVSGRIVNGQPVLEPAFQVVTRPSLPARAGPYEVEGQAADGSPLFGVRFTPMQVADDPQGEEHFAFAVPLQPDRASRLDAIRLTAPGRPSVSLRAAPAAAGTAPGVRVARLAPDRVSLRWDAAAHPMLMVRDPATGQVLSFARGGEAVVATQRGDLEVQLSDGVAGRTVRVAVPR